MGWIPIEQRLPTKEDGDMQGCVQTWHVFNGTMLMQWHLVAQHGMVTHWMRTPEPPDGHQELRKKYMEGIRRK